MKICSESPYIDYYYSEASVRVMAKRFKHGRRTFLYSAMKERTGMQLATLGKSDSEAAP